MPDKKSRRCLILLSGGTGSRMGSEVPKQYIEVKGKTILEYTLQAMSAWKEMDSVVIVAAPEYRNMIADVVESGLGGMTGADADKTTGVDFLGFADPGENRQLSIRNALSSISDRMVDDAWVMIHDAARPLVPPDMLERMENARADFDGVMPYLTMKDTVYESLDGVHISSNLNRDTIVAGQTPEYFAYWKYKDAVDALNAEEILAVHGTTEPAVAAGMNIAMVPGDETNLKITTPDDLRIFEGIIGKRESR